MSVGAIIAITVVVVIFILALLALAIALVWLTVKAHAYTEQFKVDISAQVNTLAFKISELRGDDLIQAVVEFRTTIKKQSLLVERMERATLAMGALAQGLLSEEEVKKNALAPEEYAKPEPGEKFVTQSAIAQRDARSLGEEI